MNKPYVDNPKYFIKKKSGFLVAGWIGYKGKELHGDYDYVRDRGEGEKLLNDLKKSEGNIQIIVENAEHGYIHESYGAMNVEIE